MKRMKKILSLICVFVMLLTQIVFADEAALTNVQPESPSNWALWDVQMSSIYGLGTVDTYANYTKNIVGQQFKVVADSMVARFDVAFSTGLYQDVFVTRGRLIKDLLKIIKLAMNQNYPTTAIDNFVSNPLITGRISGYYVLTYLFTN